jgi:hypothetical protein
MPDFKRRAGNALPLKRGAAASSLPKIEVDRLRETLQKSIIDNPKTAQKAALIVGLWLEGKSKKKPLKKAA